MASTRAWHHGVAAWWHRAGSAAGGTGLLVRLPDHVFLATDPTVPLPGELPVPLWQKEKGAVPPRHCWGCQCCQAVNAWSPCTSHTIWNVASATPADAIPIPHPNLQFSNCCQYRKMGGAYPPRPLPFSETYACLSVSTKQTNRQCLCYYVPFFLFRGGRELCFVSGVIFFYYSFPSSVNRQLSDSSSVSTCPPSICGATAPAVACSALGLILADSVKGAVGSFLLQELQGVPLSAELSSCSGNAPVLLSHIYKHQIRDGTRFRGVD